MFVSSDGIFQELQLFYIWTAVQGQFPSLVVKTPGQMIRANFGQKNLAYCPKHMMFYIIDLISKSKFDSGTSSSLERYAVKILTL